jgi:putative membrane protein insertion efficiency factor
MMGLFTPVRFALRGLIRVYQWLIAPLLPPNRCRFAPSCSHYGLEAIAAHGALAGSFLILHRLLRCHPWGGSGYDPVPRPLKWPTPFRRPQRL